MNQTEYQSLTATGAVRHTVTGVAMKPTAGCDRERANWLVNATSLGGIRPAPGDRLRGRDGTWWVVRTVDALDGGSWPLACLREHQTA